eukprot:Blabericola_migrator_1__1542@NODE_1407_length_4613_cov_55_511659_g204_i1_p1_GENE_NODE_1407_length_4613_cov_55_511659_g204_i1NODE_1407_length_4613_cov_55_511659_g204_i1_p1_ORF_typecomplete_len511_score72_33SET/PF00856_28/4_8e15SET/PF00856_28/1_8e03ProkRING_1/PF14446_6/0_7ProkRING_1/PF14446_6/18DZR/PF12773_7/0_52zfC2H2_3/PF13878_6/6_1e02zfC2H2_3/PF13878_6/0_68zincribbons_6/PF07191_12/2_1zincribbons_6/PF07191_12/8_1e02zincribbons_6/PF07191_12/5_7e03_NODE_1407_length_4613_cov_55_511659_g204_i1383191
MLKLGTSPYGWGLFAIQNIEPGSVVLQEQPYLIAPINVEGLYLKFLSLTDEQLKFLSTLHANVFALTVQDEADIERVAPKKSSPHWAGFRWFLALMISNAHGIAQGLSVWSIYEHGCRVNHSCAPNVAYRNEDGVLIYVAIQPIKKNEEVTVAYVDHLYASQSFRQDRILTQKLFLCDCPVCNDDYDATRRIWCPHCRTKEDLKEPACAVFVGSGTKIKHLDQYQMTRQANSGMKDDDEWWICTECNMTYTSAILPIAVEKTLTGLFLKLNSKIAYPNIRVWQQYLMYLHKTAMAILGPLHWLTASCHYLYSRFYVALWNGGQLKTQYKDLACDHGLKFFEYVESVAPSAVYSDVIPWASVLTRLCLASGDAPRFTKLAVKYLPKLRLLYGYNDKTLNAYESAVRYLVAVPQKKADPQEIGVAMAELAQTSIRKCPHPNDVEKLVPQSERVWLHPKAPVNKSKLDKNAESRRGTPWAVTQPVPLKFAQFAQQQLLLMQSSGNQAIRCAQK